MSNQLEKLKNSIRILYVDKFELNLMKSSGFIPVDKRQNNFYVIINKSFTKNKDSISSIVKQTLGEITPQFIPIESADFDEIFRNINAQSNSEGAGNTKNSERTIDVEPTSQKELSAEEMLVGIGWLTENQLREAQRYSIERNIPLDGAFYEKEFLTPDKIA